MCSTAHHRDVRAVPRANRISSGIFYSASDCLVLLHLLCHYGHSLLGGVVLLLTRCTTLNPVGTKLTFTIWDTIPTVLAFQKRTKHASGPSTSVRPISRSENQKRTTPHA